MIACAVGRAARGRLGLAVLFAWTVCCRSATAVEPDLFAGPPVASAWVGDDNRSADGVRLRIEWGGGLERQWRGSISISHGSLADPRLLGVEADEPGSMWLEEGGRRLQINQRSRRVYDGLDLTVAADLNARLLIELTGQVDDPASNAERPARVEIRLADVLDGFHNRGLDDKNNRLMIRRAPGDKLRVVLPGDSVVYETGQVLDFLVQPHRLTLSQGRRLRLECRLQPARGKRLLWSQEEDISLDADGSADAVGVRLALPEAEGVYDLLIAACRGGLPNRLGLRQVVEQRKVQVVVLSGQKPRARETVPPMQTLVELDPAKPAWWERFAHVPLIPGLNKGPLGNGDAAAWQHPLGEMVQLGPGGREPDISWEAYPLPIHRPGQPHVIEVEYPSDVPQTLGLSVVEPNAAGAVLPIGLDSGIYVPAEAAGTLPRLAKHRLIFWPRTKSPLLLMTNRREGSRAVYGKIRVLGPRATGMGSLVRESGRSQLPPAFDGPPGQEQRLLAAYYDRPLFAENFSATEDVDDFSGRSLDDWQTFYEGATRLVEYLKHAGHNGVMLSVLADGSAIYPSQLLDATPRYDTGVFFANGQDPFRKDVLELLLRLFDREGLRLIPALEFAAPLPALEAARRRGEPGVELVGSDGRTWLETRAPRRGLAPYYNPLNAEVQQAMLAVVDELVERYGHHPSLSGVALQLSADGYAQLPGAAWAYDDDTVSRFSRETKVALPMGEAHFTSRVELLSGTHQEAWLAWRCRGLGAFHQQLQTALARSRPGTRLYLAGANMLDSPDFARQLRPALPRSTSNEAVLRTAGIDPSLYRSRDQIMLLRPERIAPLDSLAEQAVNLELNHDARLDRLFGSQDAELDRQFGPAVSAGSLFFHEPQSARLKSFDAKSPFKRTHAWLVAQPVSAGPHNRKRFVHALATLDARAIFDGGWLLPIGHEDELRDLFAVYRELPDEPFETLAGETQPVTLRTLSRPDRTYVYLVNDSPWNATVRIAVQAPPDCRVQSLGGRRLPGLPGGDKQTWTIELAPYDLASAALLGPGVRLTDPQVEIDGQVPALLKSRIEDLWDRANVLKQPPPVDLLSNAGFEEPFDRRGIAGWELVEQGEPAAGAETQGEAGAELDTMNPQSGQQSLRLIGGPGTSWLSSEAFRPPETGWLSMTVWLRLADADRQPELRLALEGLLDGREYKRTAAVGRGAGVPKLAAQWGQYSFEFPDLPTARLSDLKIRFELSGPGEVWIDEVRLLNLEQLAESQLLALAKTIGSAGVALDNRRYSDCLRLLDGYWPRYLTSHVVLTEQPLVGDKPSRPKAAAPAEPPTEKTGVLDRVKRAVGGWLR
ncbi:MAG: family 10 glycosylhydrolase [Pirellulales bacterium]